MSWDAAYGSMTDTPCDVLFRYVSSRVVRRAGARRSTRERGPSRASPPRHPGILSAILSPFAFPPDLLNRRRSISLAPVSLLQQKDGRSGGALPRISGRIQLPGFSLARSHVGDKESRDHARARASVRRARHDQAGSPARRGRGGPSAR